MLNDGKPTGRRSGRLNAFQKTMLHWNSLHPYNAVHVVRLAGVPALDRLKRAIEETLSARDLTGLTLNARQGTYSYLGGPAACEIAELNCRASVTAALAAEIERQLNTPFTLAGPGSPFRFFVARGEGSFALGLAYLHAVADAESIALLFKEIVEKYGERTASDGGPGLNMEPRLLKSPLFSHPGAFARKAVALPGLIRDLRGSWRPHYRDANDLHNGVALFSLEPRSLRCLVQASKAWGITVNDLLLALLLKSCALLAKGLETAKRRKRISVGCIVNTRRDLGAEYERVFGLCLGSFVVTHAVPKQLALAELARDIGRRTLQVKRKKLYLATLFELSFGQLMLRFFSRERRLKLYPKHYPLSGGLTNMNINSLWRPREGEPLVDYLRAVSTGPVTPLVLSFTTAGEAANIGLSYRSTVFTAPDIERLRGCFVGTLAQVEQGK